MSPMEPNEARDRIEAWLADVPMPPAPDPAALLPGAIDHATAELVFSMLVWEAGVPHAVSAARRLAAQFVDVNELRVALVVEVEDTIGLTDAHANRRARMIVGTLMHVFETQDGVSIDRIARGGAHEAGPYLSGIEGLAPFVVDRVLALVLGEPRVPIDDRLRRVLIERGVIGPSVGADAAAELLVGCCPAGGAKSLYLRLEAASSREGLGVGRD
ncbi:MAG: hypothetical protein KIT54_12350 [Phycisphaeraceae bacterium]|nr:hypothetical protein [Phycisphaeraceae bacterium]